MKKNKSITAPKVGMNRDTHPSQLKNIEYSLGVNVNSTNESGDSLNVQLEPSNYFGIQFPANYKVIGYKTDVILNRTYYFLTSLELNSTSPNYKRSSIGYVDNNDINVLNYDNSEITEYKDCEECNKKAFNPLTDKLEETVQTPSLQYVELINDKCLPEGEGLNFSIESPFKAIELNKEKLGTTLYFNDNRNPPRYLNITDLEQKGDKNYLYEVEDPCSDSTYSDCIDVDKLLIFPKHNNLKIVPVEQQTGGNLKQGTYEFRAAYCDAYGNVMTNYSTSTNPVSIFDENDNILSPTEIDKYTNFAIKLQILDLDVKHFKYYKVAVIERNTVANTQSPFLAGIYPTTDDTVVYTHSSSSSDDTYTTRGNTSVSRRLSFNELNAIKPNWKKAKFTMTSGDILWHGGLEKEEELNLQPVINLFSGLLHWETSAASEHIYKEAIATAKYKAYPRGEVQPFSFRLLLEDGGYTANFPLVGRPASEYDRKILTNDKNLNNINANSPACATTDRKERWQVYNTAYEHEDICTDINQSSVTVEEDVVKKCTIEGVHTVGPASLIIDIDNDYSTLEEYIEANLTAPALQPLIAEINQTYPGECQPKFIGDCKDPVKQSERNEIAEIVNIKETFIEKTVSEYDKAVPPSYCSLYAKTDTGDYIIDETTKPLIDPQRIFERDSLFYNEKCGYAETLILQSDIRQTSSSFFLNLYGTEDITELKQDEWKVMPETVNRNFLDRLHYKAQFFKASKNGRDKIILEITELSNFRTLDYLRDKVDMRYTLYSSCSAKTVLGGGIIDTDEGVLLLLDLTTFPNEDFLIAIDSHINFKGSATDLTLEESTAWIISPPTGCFSVHLRDIEYKQVAVSWDGIVLDKVQEYQANCTFNIPKIDSCGVVPYRKGTMSFWESTETYSDNSQLWDSSKLKINDADLAEMTETDKIDFITYYTSGKDNEGNYILKNADLRCQPIRHPKFPDNTVAPYIIESTSFQNEADSIIFPLGIEFDSKALKTALNVAVKNGLITQKQRDNIKGYEILRGDNSISKSIVANGIAFDFYNYEKEGKTVNFSNFPFNDLGRNKYCLTEEGGSLINHPYGGRKNHMFSFLSPDIFLTKPALPTEVSLQGYVMGSTQSQFTAVEDHSEWTVLGDKARKTAVKLASVEVALEFTFKAASLTAQQFAIFGVASGVSLGLVGAGIAAAAAGVGGVMRVGKYRYDWLKTFRDLGRTYNFASFHTGVANYNKFIKADQNSENYLRQLTIKKYLNEGDHIFVDSSTAEQVRINNWQREASVFLSTGKSGAISYDETPDYMDYDNNNVSSTTGSNFVASEINRKENVTVQKNVASPYFTLKNYIPDQWGTIDSIKWLTTNYTFDIEENTRCKPIYGGTFVISRFSWRRKTPIFKKNAVGLADKLPFMYSRYENIGFPRYYANYELDEGENMYKGFLGLPFPDINSKVVFDCETGRSDMYFKPPSKFYTSVHGVANFLVESEINCNFRYAGKEPKDWFYPQQSDLATWLQETNLPLSEPNTFLYNNAYSLGTSNSSYKVLDRTYDKEIWRKRGIQENAVIWSQKDVSENQLLNPWLVYKPLNWHEFKTANGALVGLQSIENNQFLARFEDKLLLHNAVDNISERLTPQNTELGTASIFNQRPREFSSTDLGFMGTQHTDMVSTPYGHFWVDAKRGKIFKLNSGGQGIEIISEQIGNRSSNMKQWFREHLPMKILRDLPEVDVDNKYKGIGYNMWYDDREERLFITKRDYRAKNTNCLAYSSEKGVYNSCSQNQESVYFDNTSFFEDVSWTISYKLQEGSWNSYFTFYPDYTVYHSNNFQTGYNWGVDKETSWNHLMGKNSFGVFQGKLNTPVIEFPVLNENVNKILTSIALNIEALHYQNDWDSSSNGNMSFKNLYVFNNNNCTGMLGLNQQKSLTDSRSYPKNSGDVQEILYTLDDGKQNINYLFNRVVNPNNNIPIFAKDPNNILKKINKDAVSFKGKKVLDRLRGEYFTIHLEGIQDSRYNLMLKNIINNEIIYE